MWSIVGSANSIGLDCLLATEQDNLTICVHVGRVDDDYIISHCLEYTASISVANPIFPEDLIVFRKDFTALNIWF